MPLPESSPGPPSRERLRERLIQLTRDLVLMETTDDRPEERRRCFQWIRNHLEEVPGLQLRRYEKNGYESLLALPAGSGQPDLLFCGHLDVVCHPDAARYRSEVRDGCIHGPGAGDMKGQLAVMIELMRELGRGPASVGMLVTSDEERGGENGVRFLVEEQGLRCGRAIIPDGGSLAEIIVEEKGILHLRLEASGFSAHAARPWQGRNALESIVASAERIRARIARFSSAEIRGENDCERNGCDNSKDHWHPTCSLTMLATPNDSPNRIPETASAVMDIRFVPPATAEELLAAIGEELAEGVRAAPIISAEPTHLAPDPAFVEITGRVSGETAALVRSSGGSDARFFSALGIPVMLSRPRVGNLHGRDEWIGIDSMLDYYRICLEYAAIS